MEKYQIFVFVLLNYSITNIIVFASIFKWLRDITHHASPNFLGVLFSCPKCMGFWVGIILSLTFYSPVSNLGVDNILFNSELWPIFLDGCLGSGTTWLIYNVAEALEVYHSSYDED